MYSHKILVAQDLEKSFERLRRRAEQLQFPFALDWVEDGQLAVDRIKEDPSYDAIIMNIGMPLLDGIRATKIIRSLAYNKPIIAWSGHIRSWVWDACQEAGMDEYVEILKSNFMEDIIVALHTLNVLEIRFKGQGEQATFEILPRS